MSWRLGIRKQDMGTDQDLLNKLHRQSNNVWFMVYCSMGKPGEKAGDRSAKPGSARPVSRCWEVRGRIKDKGYKHWLIITIIKIIENQGWEGPQVVFALPKKGASMLLLPERCTSNPFCTTPVAVLLHPLPGNLFHYLFGLIAKKFSPMSHQNLPR